MHMTCVTDGADRFELSTLMLSFEFRKLYSFNRARLQQSPHSPRRVGLIVEQLESRLALSNDAPFVIPMVPLDDARASLQRSEDVVKSDIGDFELLQQNSSTSWQVEHSQTAINPSVQRIAALGDSMTYEGGGSYVSVLRHMLSSHTISLQTFASAGWKAEKLYSVWQNEVRDQGFDTLIVFSGIPDLSSEGATAASTFERLRELYDDATSRGLNVICMGLSPWAQYKKWTPQRQTETIRLNNLIRQHVAQHASTMRFVDTYASLGSPDEPERLWPRYDVGDGLHIVPSVMNAWRNSFQRL